MAKKTPKVQHNQLYLAGEPSPVCRVGSPEWFAWLDTASAFRYQTDQRIRLARSYTRAMPPISVCKEKRRRGYLWYAYRRAHGQLHKRYVGKTSALTVDRLDEVAAFLNEIW